MRIINEHTDTFDGNGSSSPMPQENNFNHMGEQFFSDCPSCLGAEGDHNCRSCQGLGIVEKETITNTTNA